MACFGAGVGRGTAGAAARVRGMPGREIVGRGVCARARLREAAHEQREEEMTMY